MILYVYADDVNFNDMTQYRHRDQIWAMYTRESPSAPRRSNRTYFDKLAGVFNWTLTYREDADIPLLYGDYLPRNFKVSNDAHAKVNMYPI
jgi:hypothetical protein